jgi:hypothetical protein
MESSGICSWRGGFIGAGARWQGQVILMNIGQCRKQGREVIAAVYHQMRYAVSDLQFALYHQQARLDNFLTVFIEQHFHTTRLAEPVSSSSVINKTPLAVPGLCLTVIRPAIATTSPSLRCAISHTLILRSVASLALTNATGCF